MADTVQRRPAGAGPALRPAPARPDRPVPARVRAGAFIRRHKLAPYLLLLPALGGIALVLLWPLLQVVLFSFQNYGLPQLTGALPTQWVGLANFTHDPDRPGVLAVGAHHGLVRGRRRAADADHRHRRRPAAEPAGQEDVGIRGRGGAAGLGHSPDGRRGLFYWLFNPDGGLVDWALSRMPPWLVGSTNWAQYNWTTTGALQAYTVATLLVVWTSFPFIAVSVLAGLKTVPAELYEAARVDGASRARVFRKITYPLLKPIFLVLLLLSVIWDFNIFTQTYILTGFPGNQNEYNLSLYIYDKAFGFPPSYGLGGALALIFTIIVLVVTVSYVRASVRQGALT